MRPCRSAAVEAAYDGEIGETGLSGPRVLGMLAMLTPRSWAPFGVFSRVVGSSNKGDGCGEGGSR